MLLHVRSMSCTSSQVIQNLRILFTAKKVRVRVNSLLNTLQKKKISCSLAWLFYSLSHHVRPVLSRSLGEKLFKFPIASMKIWCTCMRCNMCACVIGINPATNSPVNWFVWQAQLKLEGSILMLSCLITGITDLEKRKRYLMDQLAEKIKLSKWKSLNSF